MINSTGAGLSCSFQSLPGAGTTRSRSPPPQFKAGKQLISQVTELVIATDADIEGEIIDLCGSRGAIQRLWLSVLKTRSSVSRWVR